MDPEGSPGTRVVGTFPPKSRATASWYSSVPEIAVGSKNAGGIVDITVGLVQGDAIDRGAFPDGAE